MYVFSIIRVKYSLIMRYLHASCRARQPRRLSSVVVGRGSRLACA